MADALSPPSEPDFPEVISLPVYLCPPLTCHADWFLCCQFPRLTTFPHRKPREPLTFTLGSCLRSFGKPEHAQGSATRCLPNADLAIGLLPACHSCFRPLHIAGAQLLPRQPNQRSRKARATNCSRKQPGAGNVASTIGRVLTSMHKALDSMPRHISPVWGSMPMIPTFKAY